jgi:hypothetical protein
LANAHSALHAYLAGDHARLDQLLRTAVAQVDVIEVASYESFRAGLLRHIGIEEKLLFPLIRHAADTSLARQVMRLHGDHAALAALLIPPPSAELIAEIRTLLESHNRTEEGPSGLYEAAARLAGGASVALADQARATPPVRTAPHADTPAVRALIQKLLAAARAGDGA